MLIDVLLNLMCIAKMKKILFLHSSRSKKLNATKLSVMRSTVLEQFAKKKNTGIKLRSFIALNSSIVYSFF